MRDFEFPIGDSLVASFDGSVWEQLDTDYAMCKLWESLPFLIDGYRETVLVVHKSMCVMRLEAYHNTHDNMHYYEIAVPWRYIRGDYETHDILDDALARCAENVTFYEIAYHLERDERTVFYEHKCVNIPVVGTSENTVYMSVYKLPLHKMSNYLDDANGFELKSTR